MVVLALAHPLGAFQAPEVDLSHSEMRPYLEAFTADRGNLQRTYTVAAFPGTRERFRAYYTEWRERLATLNFDAMSQDGKVDYILFRNYLDHELRKLEFEGKSQAELAAYLPFAPDIAGLEEARRKILPMEAKQAAGKLAKLTAAIDHARKAADEKPPLDARKRRELGSRAAKEAGSLHTALRSWFTFYDAYDPLFTWWAAEPYRAADKALTGYETFLWEKVAGLKAPEGGAGGARDQNFTPAGATAGSASDIIGNPIGREGLISELDFEMIPYTPEELIDIANREFTWCEGEMRRASREMGFGEDWKAALEKVKLMYPEPGKQPEIALGLAKQAEKFLDDHNLVTVPSVAHETWRMRMMPPSQQLVAPFFLGGETLLVAFPTSGMSHEQKMNTLRGNSVPFSHAVVFHELIPGHELQGYMAARYKAYRRAAFGGTPFLTEGWALHWELEMWDLGFHKTPEERIGALFWHMHRCARIIFSLSFHLGKMTPQECIDFLVERVGFERENATGEVRRSFGGGYGPLYQAAYLLGGLQIYALQKELVGPGKMTVRQFHDAVLKENSIPVEMIRAALSGQRLTRDYSTNWRFPAASPVR